jgi:hypothetical protein
MAAWLRDELRPLLEEVLLGGVCRELFDEGALRTAIEEHTTGARDRSRMLFALLSFGLWHDVFVGESRPLALSAPARSPRAGAGG